MSVPSPRPSHAAGGGVVGNRRRRHDDNDSNDPHRRVVLLLDMDCFYAQCETVRLGLDQSIPLALVQWNSALAVNYPAREYGIKRGDSYEAIREKSGGECVAIHLPVTPLDEGSPSSPPPPPPAGDEAAEDGVVVVVDSSESAYDDEYNRPTDVREQMYRAEKNRMRSPTEGKACLDRYRVASSRIFALIDDTLALNLGRKNFILERASIDELFIDVTAFCYQSRVPSERNNVDDDAVDDDGKGDAVMKFRAECDANANRTLKETIVCHEASVDAAELNDEVGAALRRGCHVASTARRAVLETLGFTLSAGISTNKLVAKLAATFGKPNGQAVVFPSAMSKLMDGTQIRKARMLGGKLGKKVMTLLPESETTMGSISRLLPLDRLEKAIGVESGRWVFDACRGIDFEEVKATLKVLLKSITAFKSFPKVSYPELEKWTALLARDIMKRVEVDNARNSRLPKSVSVGYTMVPGGAWIGRTFRLPFPTDKDFNSRVQKLVDGTRKALSEKGHSGLIRIGFSAIDFVVRPKIGIDSFFCTGVKSNTLTATKRLVDETNAEEKESGGNVRGNESFFSARKHQSASPKTTSTTVPSLDSHDNTELCGESPNSKKNRNRTGSAALSLREMNGAGFCDNSHDNMTLSSIDIHTSRHGNNMADEEVARRLQDSLDKEINDEAKSKRSSRSDKVDKDEALALLLQSTYDREDALQSHMEKFSAKRKNNDTTRRPQKKDSNNKKNKLDFFLKK